MQRVSSAGVAGTGSPFCCCQQREPGRHVAGGEQARVVDVDDRPQGRDGSRAGKQGGQVGVRQPRSVHLFIDSVSTHRPITFLRKRIVPSTPPSLVKSANRAASVSTGSSSSRPTNDQVPEEMYADAAPLAGHTDDGRSRVVRPNRDHRSADAERGRRRRAATARPDRRPNAAAAESRRVRRPCRRARWPTPSPGRRTTPSSRRWFVRRPAAGQPVAQQVRQQQQGRGLLQVGRASGGDELVDAC